MRVYVTSWYGVKRVIGADGRNRTGDLRITNALLYQLSYIGVARIIAELCDSVMQSPA